MAPELVTDAALQVVSDQGHRIGEGAAAPTVLEGLLLREDALPAEERKKLRRQLLDDCERDTLATVRVYESLAEHARSASVGRR